MKELPFVIGISGKIGSGKDTVAKIIKDCLEEKNIVVKIDAFANKLKENISLLSGVPINEIVTREGKARFVIQHNMTVGEMLQKVSEGIKKVLPNVWISALDCNWDRMSTLVISDMRFKSEYEYVNSMAKYYNICTIRVNGDPLKIREKNVDKRNLQHISEVDLDNEKFMYVIDNNRGLDELKKDVIRILKKEDLY
jgi:hypothetical protein